MYITLRVLPISRIVKQLTPTPVLLEICPTPQFKSSITSIVSTQSFQRGTCTFSPSTLISGLSTDEWTGPIMAFSDDNTDPIPSQTRPAVPETGRGFLPPTVSPPGIHYTSGCDARAFILPGTIIFIAYNRTYKKRILHPLHIEHGLSLFEQRPLYLQDNPRAQGTITIFDLVREQFCDEPASLHLLEPPPGFSGDFSEHSKLASLNKEFIDMSSKLPFIPFSVHVWNFPPRPPPEKLLPGPRMIRVSDDPVHVNAAGRQLVIIDGYYCPINQDD